MDFARELDNFLVQCGVDDTLEDLFDLDFMDDLIKKFENGALFLDRLPDDETSHNVFTGILEWVYSYYIGNSIQQNKGDILLVRNGKDAAKRINKTAKVIKDFEAEIEGYFSDFLQEMEEYGEEYHIAGPRLEHLQKVREMLDTARSIRNDLENREFSWIQRHHFYKPTLTTKKELFDLLREANRRFGLGATYADIKAFVDALPQWQ